MGLVGLEPTTYRLKARYSIQLSYRPIKVSNCQGSYQKYHHFIFSGGVIDTFGSVTDNKKGEETFSFSPLSYDFYGLHVTYVYPYSQTEEIPYDPRKWDQEY